MLLLTLPFTLKALISINYELDPDVKEHEVEIHRRHLRGLASNRYSHRLPDGVLIFLVCIECVIVLETLRTYWRLLA